MRIAIFGSGGVGGYFGGRLALSGEDVTFIARGEHLRAIRTTGLKVDSTNGDFLIHPAQATSEPAEVGPVDLIILGVKAWQVPEAARAMKPMIGSAPTVLPLENGVEATSQLTAELGRAAVIGGLCKIVSFVVGPGHIRHAGFDPTVMYGELDNSRSDRIGRIHQIFTSAGVSATIADDINVALWQKFLFIAAYSGVGALHRSPAGGLRSDPEIRSQLWQAMKEIAALAQARGIKLPEDALEKAMASVDGLPEDATSSMQRDITAGKPSELESQTGAVVRMGRESGVGTPINQFIYEALRADAAKVP